MAEDVNHGATIFEPEHGYFIRPNPQAASSGNPLEVGSTRAEAF